MGQLVLGVVGGIIGSFFGMPQLGFLLGSLVGSLLFPPKAPDGPRLSNLQVTSSAYGQFIPIGYGTARIGGNVIWAKNIIEKVGHSGGKGGKGGGKTYTYYFTGAIGLADCTNGRPIKDIIRAWADTKLIYDKTGASTSSQLALATGVQGGSKKKGTKDSNGNEITHFADHFRLYKGTEDQMPDSIMESKEGVGNVSAHRGMAYLVLDEFPLADFGARVPNFTFEVVFSGSQEQPKDKVVATFLPSGPLGTSFQRGTLAVDWVRNRFFCFKTGSDADDGIHAFRISDMVEYDQRTSPQVANGTGLGAGTIADVQICMNDGNIYTGSGGSSNSSPLVSIDGDALVITGAFGSNNNSLSNSETSFTTTVQLVPMVAPGSPSPGVNLLCIGFFGSTGVLTTGMAYVAGANSTDLPHNDNFGVPSFVPGVAFVLSYSTSEIILCQCNSSDGVCGVVGTLNPADFDENWTAWDGPNLSQPVLDQSDGNIIFGVKGKNTAVPVNWSGPDYTTAPTWDATKEYSKLDGVKNGTHYYVSIADNNLGETPGSSPQFWQLLSDPTTPTFSYYRVVKYDVTTASVVWSTVLPQGASPPPSDTSHVQSRVNNGLYAWCGLNNVVYCDTSDGDLTVDTGYTVQPLGSQAFDGGANIIIVQDVNSWSKLILNRHSAGTDTAAGVITDLVQRVGLTADDIDVSDLESDTVDGYIINNQGTVRDCITPLAMSFFFDAVESDDKIKFVKRGGSSVVTITQDDMIAPSGDGMDSTVFAETRIQELDLPRQISITYADKDNAYQQGQQSSPRVSLPAPTMFSQNNQDIQIPLAMSGNHAKQIAEKMLWASWLGRVTGKWSASPAFLVYEPTDIVTVNLNNNSTYVLRLTEANVGADFSVEMTGVSERPTAYQSSAVGGSPAGIPQQTVEAGAAVRTLVFDSPYFADFEAVSNTVATIHAAGGRYGDGSWPGDVVLKSTDGGSWSNAATLTQGSAWGSVITPLSDTDNPWATDYTSTMTVVFFAGADDIDNATYADMLNGANMAAIINPITGNVEIINFQNRTINADGSITFDTFLRGQRGTDTMTDGHTGGEVFLLVSQSTLSQIALGLNELNAPVYFKGVGGGMTFDYAPTLTTNPEGRSLMPYSVQQIAAEWDGGAIDLTWERRTRFNGELIDGTDTVALNETTETYEIDIYDGDDVIRTLTVDYGTAGTTHPGATYTAQMIADDFGVQPATLKLAIYQMSAAVGRGFGEPVTVEVTGVAAATTRYYGVLSTTTPTAADIKALSNNDLEPDATLSFTYNASGGAYPTFAFPNTYTVPSHVKVNGLPFSDFASSTLTVDGTTYRVLRFNLLQHGASIPVDWA